jgi:hypothetical protein
MRLYATRGMAGTKTGPPAVAGIRNQIAPPPLASDCDSVEVPEWAAWVTAAFESARHSAHHGFVPPCEVLSTRSVMPTASTCSADQAALLVKFAVVDRT